MSRWRFLVAATASGAVALALLAACATAQPPGAPTLTGSTRPHSSAAPAPTPTQQGPASDTPGAQAAYYDDRSGPAQLLRSYVSALNRKEYLRAYAYWQPAAAAAQLPPFPEFAQRFADPASV